MAVRDMRQARYPHARAVAQSFPELRQISQLQILRGRLCRELQLRQVYTRRLQGLIAVPIGNRYQYALLGCLSAYFMILIRADKYSPIFIFINVI